MVFSKLVLTLFLPIVFGIGQDDLVTLPDVEFVPNFDSYAGYLNANEDGNLRMFYFLTTSKSPNTSTDPLLIWLNGGPGCSSFSGQFKELGPYYASLGGKSLFENPYSWNANAHVLFLESPIGVGFSYDRNVENVTEAGDDLSAKENYQALKNFFTRVQPKLYGNRPFYVAGESYAGVYVPQLVKMLVEGINNGDFPNKNLEGMAVGNGDFNIKINSNSKIIYKAERGMIGLEEWETLKTACRTGNETDVEKYNFMEFMLPNPEYHGEFIGDNSTCGRILDKLISEEPAGEDIKFDIYNMYQDCYDHGNTSKDYSVTRHGFNYHSSDQLGGYKCYFRDSSNDYINRRDVMDALKIAPEWRSRASGKQKWKNCNSVIYDSYNFTYRDSQPFFDYIISNNKNPNFRVLLFSGDADTICNFKGIYWFMEEVANTNNLKSSTYEPWLFAKQMAGYAQRYSGSNIDIDVLTVKGAGHFVPVDRPGAAHQMINNFMFTQNADVHKQYSKKVNGGTEPKFLPLKDAILKKAQ